MIRPSQYTAAKTGASHIRTRRVVRPGLLRLRYSPTGFLLLPGERLPAPGAQGPTERQMEVVALRDERCPP